MTRNIEPGTTVEVEYLESNFGFVMTKTLEVIEEAQYTDREFDCDLLLKAEGDRFDDPADNVAYYSITDDELTLHDKENADKNILAGSVNEVTPVE